MKWRDLNTELSNEIDRVKTLEPDGILGVPRCAARAEIKAAYRRLARIYHPDRADVFMRLHNERMMRIINEAYASLVKSK